VYNFAFVMEQALGHVTHTKNLQHTIPSDPTVEVHWGLVPWETSGIAAHIPIYNNNWTVRSGLRARSTVARIARRTPLDALFFHTQVPAVLSTNWIKRIPSVVSLDATPRQYDALGDAYSHQPGPAWLERQKWNMNRACFRAAHSLVTWSHWAKQGLIDEYDVPADKVFVIPPGVNPREWSPPTPRRPHDAPVNILFVGGDLERKGGHLLLQAFRALRPLGVALHMVTRDSLPEEPGLFVYNGIKPNSEEMRQLYAQADIFCLPTFGDCLPMVLSEAGAAALPLVSTHVAAIPEIVRDEQTGFLVPAGEIEPLVQALRRLVVNVDLRLTLGEHAQSLVSEQFDAQRNARHLLDVIKQTADSASRNRSN
jgi:glycosyltransferase involved in cell wall biosynthesis